MGTTTVTSGNIVTNMGCGCVCGCWVS